MKTTPGPWVSKFAADGSGNIGIVSHNNDPSLAECIAEVFTDIDSKGASSAETLPNARLIAAAPDMYEACRKALIALRQVPSMTTEQLIADTELTVALKKADGI